MEKDVSVTHVIPDEGLGLLARELGGYDIWEGEPPVPRELSCREDRETTRPGLCTTS